MKTLKNNAKSIIGVAAVLGIAISLVVLFLCPKRSLVFDWEPGMTYSYRLSYRSLNQTTIPMQGRDGVEESSDFSAAVDLVATLGFRVYDEQDGVFRMGVFLADFEKRDMNLMGEKLDPSPQEFRRMFEEQEAIVEMSNQGEVLSLLFEEQAEPLYKNLVQTLLGELQVRLGGDERKWESEEANSHGVSQNRYAVESCHGQELLIEKVRDNYTKFNAVVGDLGQSQSVFQGDYSIAFHRDGYFQKIHGSEEIRIQQQSGGQLVHVDTEIALSLLSIESFDNAQAIDSRILTMDRRQLGEIVISQRAERQALEQRAAGMTVDRVIDDVIGFGNATRLPYGSRWLWRAVGALRLAPEECRKLVDAFFHPGVHERGKNLILELLAATGHEQAQSVMVDLLSRTEVSASKGYPKMIQRLGGVESPGEKTTDFIWSQFQRSRNEATPRHFATAYTLAGIASSLGESGEHSLAKKYNRELVNLLQEAEDSRVKYHYLRCVGATGLEENVELIAAYRASDNPVLRRATAAAFRHIRTPRTEQVLGELLGDTDRDVQSRTLNVLRAYDFKEEQFARLEEIVNEDKLQRSNYDQVANLLALKLRESPDDARLAHKTLSKMLERDLPAKVRYQVRKLMEQYRRRG